MEDCTYNARGQVTGFTHGNGVETTREYDEDLERLSRIFTRVTGTRLQDLRYSYDPAGPAPRRHRKAPELRRGRAVARLR